MKVEAANAEKTGSAGTASGSSATRQKIELACSRNSLQTMQQPVQWKAAQKGRSGD